MKTSRSNKKCFKTVKQFPDAKVDQMNKSLKDDLKSQQVIKTFVSVLGQEIAKHLT
mgnify:CR=1 FL=1